jgi:phosphoserine phosphatase RsbU/P
MHQKTAEEILVVDDDPLTRTLLVQNLSSAGYYCREAQNGGEAWTQVHARQPALVLLDLEMPGLDGAELLKRLRTDRNPAIAQIPAIMLTGHGSEESEVLCLEAGANDFVTKPINTTILRARIETQLRLQSMQDQLRQQNDELEAWRRNLERDLAAARSTQQSLIPRKPLKLPGWEVAAAFRPVIEVGGDIYGWLPMKDGRVLFWIADATGHGASAALLTTLTKLLFHHSTMEQEGAAAIMQAVNDDFREIFGAHLFMTAMCVALDPGSGAASIVGAGHPPLLLLRQDAEPEFIASVSPPLGLAKQTPFAETTIHLHPGDVFILYTDGLFRMGGEKGATRIPERLVRTLDRSAPKAETLLAQLLPEPPPADEPGNFADDIAVVLVRRTG